MADIDEPTSGGGAEPPEPPEGGGGAGGGGNLEPVQLEEQMREAYLDYAMSVIVGRALPDVRDGLKPVHRRVLYGMQEAGYTHNKPYFKSARVVGDVIGKYHPHGDAAVYDTVVRLAQSFSMREPLIDGQGNFGSIDGDPPAAMRYTEVRLTKLASELLADLDKETVDFIPNYDEKTVEPVVLPAGFPNLLVNGAQGIAVGMATNIPPHNLRETIDACVALIEDPGIDLEGLMRIMPGPDFPTGGTICGRDGIRRAYETGRGAIKIRALAEVEERKKGGSQIAITELPYQVNKAKLIERIAELVGEKKIEGISDVRDESDRRGLRVVIELRRDAVPQVTLNQLWAQTALESSFSFNTLAIVNGQPRLCTLRDCLDAFIEHRREVITRRSAFELREAEKAFHQRVGLLVALDNIDRVIEIIRGSPEPATAKERLVAEPFKALGNLQQLVDAEYQQITEALEAGFVHLTEAQAQAILDLRLHRLTGLEADKLRDEARKLRDEMKRLRGILADDGVLMQVVVDELKAIRDTYGNDRRTRIEGAVGVYTDEDLIAEEDMVVTCSHLGYVKRTAPKEFRAQRRGGRGVAGTDTKAEDFVERLFVASTHAYLLVFTHVGKVYWVKVHQLPVGGRTARGRPLVNMIQMGSDERVSAILPVREFVDAYVVTASKNGTVKKSPLSDYSRPRASGIIGAGIADGDEIIAAQLVTDEQDILLGTKKAMAIRFKASELRSMGRPSVGVKGIRLDAGDEVVGMAVLDPGATILTVTENGYGKRTNTEEYRLQGRAGRGIILMKAGGGRNGDVVAVKQVTDDDHVMLITNKGVIIRMECRAISVLGRNTQGVRLVRVGKDDRVQAVSMLEDPEEDEPENTGAGAGLGPNGAAPPDGASAPAGGQEATLEGPEADADDERSDDGADADGPGEDV
jgi:DNA gyrase subunit A